MKRIEAIMTLGSRLCYQSNLRDATTIEALKYFVSEEAANTYRLYLEEKNKVQDESKFRSVIKLAESLTQEIITTYKKLSDAEESFVEALEELDKNSALYSADEADIQSFDENDLSDDASMKDIEKFLIERLGIAPDKTEYMEDDAGEYGYGEYLYVYGQVVHIVFERSGGQGRAFSAYLTVLDGVDNPIGIDCQVKFKRDIAQQIGKFVQVHKPILSIDESQLKYSTQA